MDITQNKIIIALDGYSSCGKSTFAKAMAKEYGYAYIDTGAMYRAVTFFCMNNGLINGSTLKEDELKKHINEIEIRFRYSQENKRNETWLNGENVEDPIRTIEVSNFVSIVSKVGFVRERLVALQQDMGTEKGIVMDGRDIGTVVFPNAELKIFMTAGVDIRAERRYKELIEKGDKVSYDEIAKNIADRDHLDETRDIAPLKKAEDAYVLDNSHMTPAEQMVWIRELLESI